MKIIVNADDLGYSADRDELAFSLMESGKITSSTLMSVAPNFENAVQRAKSVKGISFGVHLTLTEFKLISGNPLFRELGITNDDDYVTSDVRKKKGIPFLALQKAIFREWKLQIEKVLEYGIKVSHLDSHHHIHNTWWIFPVIKRLQKQFGIRRFRSITRYYLFSDDVNRFHFRSNFRHYLLRHCCYSTRTPDYFVNFEEGCLFLKKNQQFDVDATVEMMCHPGHPGYVSETQLLMTNWEDDIKRRYHLISYNEI